MISARRDCSCRRTWLGWWLRVRVRVRVRVDLGEARLQLQAHLVGVVA